MWKNKDENLHDAYRERRRRGVEIRCLASGDFEAGDSPALRDRVFREPVYGSMSVAGKCRYMEDAVAVRTNLCRPAFNAEKPVHFFAVFDGHGGSHVAALCKGRMHGVLEEELMRMEPTSVTESGVGMSGDDIEEENKWRRLMKRAFKRVDELAMGACSCDAMGRECKCHPLEIAMAGSTAVVAILTRDWIIVANCGDSRAVLSRAGIPIPLSFDHKPDRADELERIQAGGGQVTHVNGARVAGILAMSRAIGDPYLKPHVISEPEVTFTKRVPEDECLILASDGLWDCISNDVACRVSRECILDPSPTELEGEGPSAANPTHSSRAAALLTHLALARNSQDNISVIVVDLKRS